MGLILIEMAFFLPKSPKKVMVIGDLHADLDILKEILIKNSIISHSNEWCGKDTWVVCMGDTFDGCRPDNTIYDKDYLNKPMELELFYFILNLNMKATLEGGACLSLMGNHDLFLFEEKNRSYCKNVDYNSYPINREELFKPGINMSVIMANTRPLVLILGKYLFVHGGLTKNIINKEGTLYDKINSLNDELWFGLPELVKELDENEEVLVIILAAKGDTFSAGIDINLLVEAFDLNEDLRTNAEERLSLIHI